MASRMRSARRRLRKEALRLIMSGNGDRATLDRVACEIMGREVGIEEVTAYFYANEISNATKQLRIAGDVESVAGRWIETSKLSDADVESISVRRLKRLRGEAKAQLKLAHDHGRIDEAAMAGRLLEVIGYELTKRESSGEVEEVETVTV